MRYYGRYLIVKLVCEIFKAGKNEKYRIECITSEDKKGTIIASVIVAILAIGFITYGIYLYFRDKYLDGVGAFFFIFIGVLFLISVCEEIYKIRKRHNV